MVFDWLNLFGVLLLLLVLLVGLFVFSAVQAAPVPANKFKEIKSDELVGLWQFRTTDDTFYRVHLYGDTFCCGYRVTETGDLSDGSCGYDWGVVWGGRWRLDGPTQRLYIDRFIIEPGDPWHERERTVSVFEDTLYRHKNQIVSGLLRWKRIYSATDPLW